MVGVGEVKGFRGCGGGRTGRTWRVRVRKYSQASGLSDWIYAGELPWGGTPGEGQALSQDPEFCFQHVDFVVTVGHPGRNVH